MNPLQRCLADASDHGFGNPAFRAMGDCATGALGTHQRVCDHCGKVDTVPNACRSRACPFCRQRERGEWVRAREKELPPVGYFHTVFTVAAQLRQLAAADPAVFYRVLMDAARRSLLDICGDPKHLGVTPVAFAVLHTWNQRLHLHPHVHVVVSAGGLDPDGKWIHAGDTRRKAFLVPQRVLLERFKTLLIHGLMDAHARNEWTDLPSEWCERHAFKHALIGLRKRKWSMHLERPLAGPAALVRYLARYVNRVAIDPKRVVGYDGDTVRFTWQDRADGNRRRVESLPAADFLRRFRRHLPPRRFVRIRFWGLLAHRVRRRMLPVARTAIADAAPPRHGVIQAGLPEPADDAKNTGGFICRDCGIGRMCYNGGRTPKPPPS